MAMFLIGLRMASHVETLCMRWQDQLFRERLMYRAHGMPPIVPLVQWEDNSRSNPAAPSIPKIITVLERVRRQAAVSLTRIVSNPVLVHQGVPVCLQGAEEATTIIRPRLEEACIPGSEQTRTFEREEIRLIWDPSMIHGREQGFLFSGTIQPTDAFWLTALTIHEYPAGLKWHQFFSRRLTVPRHHQKQTHQERS